MGFGRLFQWVLRTSAANRASKQSNQQNDELLDKEEEDGEDFTEDQSPPKKTVIAPNVNKNDVRLSEDLLKPKEHEKRNDKQENSSDLVTMKRTDDRVDKELSTKKTSHGDMTSVKEVQALSNSSSPSQKPSEELETLRETSDDLLELFATQIQKSNSGPKRSAEATQEVPPKSASQRDVLNLEEDISKYFVSVGSAENTAEVHSPVNSDHTDSAKDVTDNMIKAAWTPDSSYKLSTRKVSLCEEQPPYTSIQFSETTIVYGSCPYMQQVHKRVVRTRHDAWRRYGALLKIHELGGWSFDIAPASPNRHGQNHMHNKNYHYVKKGTKPPDVPALPPIMNEGELLKRPLTFIGSMQKRGDRRSGRNRNRTAPSNDYDRSDKAEPEKSPSRID